MELWSPLWNPAMWAIYFMVAFWTVFMIGHTIWYRAKLRRLKEKKEKDERLDRSVECVRGLLDMAAELGSHGSVSESTARLDAQFDELNQAIEEWDPDEKQVQQMPKAGEPRRKLART